MGSEHEYHLTGTLEELQNILEDEFSMETDVAKFAVAVLTVKDDADQVQSFDDLALWYMGQKEGPYAAPLFSSRFSVSFTEVGKEIIEQIFLQFAIGIVTGTGLPIVPVVLSCIAAIVRHGTRIKKDECCPYYCALKWQADHPAQSLMSVEALIPGSGTCKHLDKIQEGSWTCPYCRDDRCQVTAAYFEDRIHEMERREVFEFVGDHFHFKR